MRDKHLPAITRISWGHISFLAEPSEETTVLTKNMLELLRNFKPKVPWEGVPRLLAPEVVQ